jgi:UDP-glucuronate 4-epimerase
MNSARKILVTGATGRVASPVVQSLAADAEVWAAARFSDPRTKGELERAGVNTFVWDMVDGSLDGLPDDFTHVMHAALLAEYDDFDRATDVTCRSVGQLMSHCRRAEAFLFVSSTVVYSRLEVGHLHRESDPLGGTSTAAWGPAYAATKIAAEGAVRAMAHGLGVPTTIARLSVQYGGDGGTAAARGGMPARYLRLLQSGRPVPVRAEGDDYCSLLHIDDIVRQVPLLWDVASTPSTVVNWGGDEAVSVRELVSYMAGVVGTTAHFVESDSAAGMVAIDSTHRQDLIGPCSVGWRDGVARLIEEQLGRA